VVKCHYGVLLNLYDCKVEVALDMFLHTGRVVLNFGIPPKLFSVYKVPVRYPTCYLIDIYIKMPQDASDADLS